MFSFLYWVALQPCVKRNGNCLINKMI